MLKNYKQEIIFILFLIFLFLFWDFKKPTNYLETNITVSGPYQTNLNKKENIKINKDYELVKKASYEIEALVLEKSYYFSDNMSKVLKYDLALAWGPLTNPKNRTNIKFWQSNRWYFYKYTNLPFDVSIIVKNSSNNHIITLNKKIYNEIKKIKKGNIVKLKGYLVDIRKLKNNEILYELNTSLTREDTGAGACEIFLVENVEIKK